jgi:hypothetical protein
MELVDRDESSDTLTNRSIADDQLLLEDLEWDEMGSGRVETTADEADMLCINQTTDYNHT